MLLPKLFFHWRIPCKCVAGTEPSWSKLGDLIMMDEPRCSIPYTMKETFASCSTCWVHSGILDVKKGQPTIQAPWMVGITQIRLAVSPIYFRTMIGLPAYACLIIKNFTFGYLINFLFFIFIPPH